MFVEYDTSAQLTLYKENPSYTITLHDNRKDKDITESYTVEHYTNVVYAIIDARDNARKKIIETIRYH